MRYLSLPLLLSTLLVAPVSLSAQVTAAPVEADSAVDVDEAPVFVVVEVMPSFPGGEEAMFKFIANEVKYPALAVDGGIQGTVYVQFIVEANGTISNAQLLRGIGSGCDEEALRVVNAMPPWTPGTQRGEAVRVQYNLPLRFALK